MSGNHHILARKVAIVAIFGQLSAVVALAILAGFMTTFGIRSEAMYIALITTLVILLFNSRPTLLIRLYCAYIIIVFIVPTIGRWIIGDVSLQYDQGPYTDALEYIFFYNCVFVGSFLIFARRRKLRDLFDEEIGNHRVVFRIGLATLLMSLVATGYLSSTGNFRALDTGDGGRILGLIKALSELGILGFVIIGVLSLKIRTLIYHLSYATAFLLLSALGTLSGSRWYLSQMFLLMYFIENRRGRYRGPIVLIAFLPLLALSFPLLGNYRNFGYDASLAIEMVSNIEDLGFFIVDSVLADRMNYTKVVQRVIETTQERGYLLFDYIDNLIGLIPRFLWPDKPAMGLNLNEIAIEMGIITFDNTTTSIGLSVIGESFYQLKTFGVIIAIAQAALFRFIEGLQKSKDIFWRFSYISFCMILIVKDSYMYIVPLLITHLLIVFLASKITRIISGKQISTGISGDRPNQ